MPRTVTDWIIRTATKGRGVEDTTDQVDDLNDSLDENSKKSDKASKSGGMFSRALGGVGQAAGVAGKVLAGGFAVGLGAAVAGAGVALKDITELNGAMNTFSARTGISGDKLDKFEKVATGVFSAGWGDSLTDVVDTMGQVNAITGAVGDTLGNLTRDTEIFTDTFETDVTETVRTADTIMENFGKSGTSTFDLLTKAMQATGDPGGDLLDTFNEYSGNFAAMGFTAEEMFSILESGLKSGARNTDDIADGMREFGIRLKDGSSDLALWSLGLSGVNQEFKAGKISGEDMFDAALQGLREIDNPLERNRLGIELFGTKWEDLGEEAFLALDKTSASLDDMEGATERAGQALQRGPAAAFERFQRTLRMGLANAIGPFIEKGLNFMSDTLDGLSGTFASVSGAVGDLFTIAKRFGVNSGQFFGMLTKHFGMDKAKEIQQYAVTVQNALSTVADFGKRAAQGLVNLSSDLLAAFQDGGLAGVGQEILNKIAAGISDLAAWGKDHIIDPIVTYLQGVDWADVPGKLGGLLSKLLTAVTPVGEWVNSKVITPIIDAIAGIDWGAVPGKLDELLGNLFTGDMTFSELLNEHIWTPLTTGLGDSTQMQNLSTQAGALAGQIISGLASGIGDLAGWVKTTVIDGIINALTGGGEDEGGVASGGETVGNNILSGIASAFVNIVSWIATNVIDPFIVGLTGQDLAGLVAEGGRIAAEFLASFATNLTSAGGAVIDAALTIGGNVAAGIQSGIDTAEGIGEALVGMLSTGIDWIATGTQAVWDFITGMTTAISQINWSAVAIGFGTLGSEVLNQIIGALSGLGAKLIDVINDAIPNEINLGNLKKDTIFGEVDLGSISFDLPDNPIPGGSRDLGGAGVAGMAYQIGKGPYTEYYIPNVSGQFVPGSQMTALSGGGAGGNITINGNMVFPDVRTPRDTQRGLEGLWQRQNRKQAGARGRNS